MKSAEWTGLGRVVVVAEQWQIDAEIIIIYC